MGANSAELQSRKARAVSLFEEWQAIIDSLEETSRKVAPSNNPFEVLDEWLEPGKNQSKAKPNQEIQQILNLLNAFQVHGKENTKKEKRKTTLSSYGEASESEDDSSHSNELVAEEKTTRTIVEIVLEIITKELDLCHHEKTTHSRRVAFAKLHLATVFALRSLENTCGMSSQFRELNGFPVLINAMFYLLTLHKEESSHSKIDGSKNSLQTSGDHKNSGDDTKSPLDDLNETLQGSIRLIGDFITKNEIKENVPNSESFIVCGGIPLIERVLEQIPKGDIPYLMVGVLRVTSHYFHGHKDYAHSIKNFSQKIVQDSRTLFPQLVVLLSSNDKDLIKQTAGALKNLCLCDKLNKTEEGGLVIPQLCEAGIVPVLFSQLNACKAYNRVVWFLLECLEALCKNNSHVADEILTNREHASQEMAPGYNSRLVEQLVELVKSPSYCPSGFSEISHKAFDILSSLLENATETISPGVYSSILSIALISSTAPHCQHMRLKAIRLIKTSMKSTDANRQSALQAMGGVSKITRKWLTTSTSTEVNKELQGLIWSQAKWKYGKKHKFLPTGAPHYDRYNPTPDTNEVHAAPSYVAPKSRSYLTSSSRGVVPVDITLDADQA